MIRKAQDGLEIGDAPHAVAPLEIFEHVGPRIAVPVEVEPVRTGTGGNRLAANDRRNIIPWVGVAEERPTLTMMRADQP